MGTRLPSGAGVELYGSQVEGPWSASRCNTTLYSVEKKTDRPFLVESALREGTNFDERRRAREC